MDSLNLETKVDFEQGAVGGCLTWCCWVSGFSGGWMCWKMFFFFFWGGGGGG